MRLRFMMVCLGVVFSMPVNANELQDTSSSDIMAEIAFLEGILPAPLDNIRLANRQQNAFLEVLASHSVCEGWSFEQYSEYASEIERDVKQYLPEGNSLQIKLSSRSYQSRLENGCFDASEQRLIVENFYGDVDERYRRLKDRQRVLRAIVERQNEMLRRTLGTSD